MRLIDADKLEMVMTEDWFLDILATQDSKSAIKKDIVNCIDNISTAYDPEKVVAELEKMSEIYCEEYRKEEGSLYLQDAMKIVRKGGVE